MDVEFVRDSYSKFNEALQILFGTKIVFAAPSFLESYGWYILIGTIVLIFYYEKFIKSLILNLKSRYDDGVYAAKYHKSKLSSFKDP